MKDKDMLDRIHRRATKLIPGLIYVIYDEILKEHGSPNNTSNAKIRGGAQIEVFTVMNGYDNIDSNIYFLN